MKLKPVAAIQRNLALLDAEVAAFADAHPECIGDRQYKPRQWPNSSLAGMAEDLKAWGGAVGCVGRLCLL